MRTSKGHFGQREPADGGNQVPGMPPKITFEPAPEIAVGLHALPALNGTKVSRFL